MRKVPNKKYDVRTVTTQTNDVRTITTQSVDVRTVTIPTNDVRTYNNNVTKTLRTSGYHELQTTELCKIL